MSDNEKLQKNDEAERDIVYHYSREHRLSRAPQTVQSLYDEKYAHPGIAKRLFGTKGNVIIFISIFVIYAIFSISSLLSSRESSVKLGGNTVALNIIREGQTLGLSIRKTAPKSGEFFIGAVDIVVSPVMQKTEEGDSPQIFGHRVFFNPTNNESFFISLPFDGNDFYVILSTEGEQKAVRVK